MDAQELQDNYLLAILYYCGQTQSDSNRYMQSIPPYSLDPAVGSLSFDENSNLIIDVWNIGGYAQPNNTTLATPTAATVQAFYLNAYANPELIISAQTTAQLTSTELTNVEKTQLQPGSFVYNTTGQKYQYLSSGSWIDASM